MAITITTRARDIAQGIADQELDESERLAIAKELVDGVLKDWSEDLDAVRCVGEGQLRISAKAIDMTLELVG